MKKHSILIAIAVLTIFLFTGCGCRNSRPMNTTEPTTMPTTAPVTETTMPTTQATTVPETTRETIEDGNGPLPTNATAGADGDTSAATEDTGLGDVSRQIPRYNEK